MIQNNSRQIGFGRFRGRRYDELPLNYLKWIIKYNICPMDVGLWNYIASNRKKLLTKNVEKCVV